MDPAVSTISDKVPEKMNFYLPFKVIIKSRDLWRKGMPQLEPLALLWFTDGSVMDGKVGPGIRPWM